MHVHAAIDLGEPQLDEADDEAKVGVRLTLHAVCRQQCIDIEIEDDGKKIWNTRGSRGENEVVVLILGLDAELRPARSTIDSGLGAFG